MTAANAGHHEPVMLDEAVDALNINPRGVYVDGTFGRGGHSALILDSLTDQGRLIAFDKDAVAVRAARERFGQDTRFSIVHGSFAKLSDVAVEWGLMRRVDGLLLDLGVSSPQLDEPARGFSFLVNGPLDMRMDTRGGLTASQWLASAEEREIADVIHQYGEERYARRIARAIVVRRAEGPIRETAQLADLVARACPMKDKHKHPATRTFQAIRIFLNRELDELQTVLHDALAVLADHARLVVISFHSLEDRIVKRFLRDAARGPQLPKGVPVTHDRVRGRLELVGRARHPSEREIRRNPRARSAVMRVAEVLA